MRTEPAAWFAVGFRRVKQKRTGVSDLTPPVVRTSSTPLALVRLGLRPCQHQKRTLSFDDLTQVHRRARRFEGVGRCLRQAKPELELPLSLAAWQGPGR
eukprot:3104629-Rhodomonas_salina.1